MAVSKVGCGARERAAPWRPGRDQGAKYAAEGEEAYKG
jgi:hypothetical protein